ncbi:MAG: tRNA-binding protein [Planctomycetota bacterium]
MAAEYRDFAKLDIRVAEIISARVNDKARRPAYVLELDCGPELGAKTSSAQITEAYTPESLTGKRVLCVVNFPPKRVAGVKSEVLVLGVLSSGGEGPVVLVGPDDHAGVRPGDRLA